MAKPVVVSIPHRLGTAEAKRRLQAGLGSVRSNFANVLTVHAETWTADTLAFRVSALGQMASGTIEVADDHVRLEVMLPWLLHSLAEKATALIKRQGQLMLGKK